MRTNLYLRSCIAVLALLAAAPAWGQFSYVSDFNSVAPGTKPPGWATRNYYGPAYDPVIFSQDPAGWNEACSSTLWSIPGAQDYALCGNRLTLIHAGFADVGAATAWYAGNSDPGYPMNLQQQSLKAEFDMFLRVGHTWINVAGDGATFAVQPVADTVDAQQAVGACGAGGSMFGWQAGGFAIEFDNWPSGGNGEPAVYSQGLGTDWGPARNHLGVDLYSFWDLYSVGFPSLQTDLDVLDLVNGPFYWPTGVSPDVLPYMMMIGTCNIPIHITVYYNDPDHGGLGQIQVYMRIPNSTGLPGVLLDLQPGGYGLGEGDPPEGKKVLDYQVGPWPSTGAVFGFSAGGGSATGTMQFANVRVSTTGVSGTALPYSGSIPQLAAGDPVTLTASPTAGTPSQPGWDVTTYASKVQLPSLGFLKRDIATDLASGVNAHLSLLASVTGEPAVDYVDTGDNGNLGRGRYFPGLTDGADHDNFAMTAKGWIQFPAAGDYSLGIGADDQVEVSIGGQVVLSGFTGMYVGQNEDIRCNLHVDPAGIYPIQITYVAATSGDGVEFYRRLTNITNPLTFPYAAIGSTNAGLADQPVVYGLLDGKAAPLDLSGGEPWTLTLSKTERVSNGTTAGASGFKVKTTPSPWIYYQPGSGYNLFWKRDRECEDWNTSALMFLDFLGNDPAHASTSDTINFATGDTTGWPRVFTGGTPFPNAPGGAQLFAMRADGFVTLSPGTYFLGLDANDQARLFIGNQAIDVVYYQPHIMLFELVVPPDAGGTYPIRVEYTQYLDVGYVDLYQVVDGTVVPVNGPGSTITVHQSVTPGAAYHAVKTNGYVIPASAKRAETGQGGTLGWNATFAPCAAEQPFFGYAEAALQYDLAGGPNIVIVAPPDTSQHPSVVAYGAGQGLGRFPGSQTNWMTAFPSCPADYDNFAVAVEGLIEFPGPGDYGFNTCTSGACKMWIGGQLVQSHSAAYAWPYNNGDPAQDNIPVSVHVDEAGLYDIRVAYIQSTAVTPTPLLEVFQYQTADASPVLLNSPGALNVFQNLADGGTPRNPVVLPTSAKVAPYDAGITPGLHAEVVSWAAASGDTYGQSVYGGLGHDAFINLHQAKDLLDAVVYGDADALLRQQGMVAFSGIVYQVSFKTDNWALPPGEPFPGELDNWFAMRLSGRIALKKGGTVMGVFADDAVIVKIGGVDVHREGATYDANEWPMMYVHAPEDGLYPIEIDYLAKSGNTFLWLLTTDPAWTVWNPINSDPNYFGVHFYADVATCDHQPFADADGDGDVDQVDFGTFQTCFTGSTPPSGPLGLCKCFDRDNYGVGNGAVDAADLAEFAKCYTGAMIPWSSAQSPDCKP
ncbi:MAG: hypothetical protein KA354_19850 [Phycisphaerae bacterium]|nr:hypothetical protein [Phycisphaerae bacterium]